jgi:uncharacterized protein YbjT (DUF2867 family)
MKIVVIGGAGLIGAKAVALLRAKGHEAVAASPRSGVNAVTGAGLSEALKGAEVVIDVSNAPSWEPDDVMSFFTTATKNLLAAEATAGVKHHVMLSIVGTDRMPDNFYYRAKVAQEALIQAAAVPYTIVRATQFYEFLGTIADVNTVDGRVHLPTGQFQPIAADEVARIVTEIALDKPEHGIVDVAGPARAPMSEIIGGYLNAQGDQRTVIADPKATYFGGAVQQDSLVPLGVARVGSIALDEWLERAEA